MRLYLEFGDSPCLKWKQYQLIVGGEKTKGLGRQVCRKLSTLTGNCRPTDVSDRARLARLAVATKFYKHLHPTLRMNSPKGFLRTAFKVPVRLRTLVHPSCRRPYHSYEHQQPPPFSAAEDSILSAALSHVPAHGFTAAALTQGARDAGYLDVSTNLFPHGPFSIVNYHLVTQRLALADNAPKLAQPPSSLSSKDVSANIRTLALRRLHANKPIIQRWQQALGLVSTARHLPTSISELARLSDEILFLAGSTTVTSAWYTNRAALATIYASSELFMTTDTSKDYVDTEDFLTRRLQEGENVRRLMEGVGAWAGMQAGGLVDGLRSKGVWI